MKKLLSMLGLASVVALSLNVPEATAGGNWLEFRGADGDADRSQSRWDIYAVGETVVAKVAYLNGSLRPGDGPFHLWIERGVALEAGKPIPAGAIRVATFEMAPDGRSGRAVFELPALPSGTLTFAVCDDPCTARGSGFGEFVQGWLTVVQTSDERRLLVRVRELRESLRSRVHRLSADVRFADRREDRLASRLDAALGALEVARAQVGRLTRAASRTPDRVLIDRAAGVWIAVGLVTIVAVLLHTRRRDRVIVPETPAELLSEDPRFVEPRRSALPSERVFEELDR